MADPRLDPDHGDDLSARPGRRSTTDAPRWLLALGIVLAVGLLALVVVLHLTGILGPEVH